MAIIGFLILFPLVSAAALLCIRHNLARRVVVCVSAAAIVAASIALVAAYFGYAAAFEFSSVAIDYVCTGLSVVITACIVYYGIRYRNVWAVMLALVQFVAVIVLEYLFAHDIHEKIGIYLDPLTLVMALIIGIVGSGICVYALGYMDDFQAQHSGQKDRRPVFFALMFLFLSAMFCVVFSNNLLWLFTAWEVTTVCSFLLIGYTKTEEAMKNAFRQIIMNLLGGLAFVAALFFIVVNCKTLSFAVFLQMGVSRPDLVVLPVTCLAFAGLTKAAQMPFHTWLLGAMVAPTPTSALLHSSTMVKAGVFLLIKLAPIFYCSASSASILAAIPSLMVILVGGVTFAFCSALAISQSNAKRVLAYSTVANLGLITACAGVGTPEAVWAAIFLVLFHAVAKSLLFLCVGTAEHHIGSRDIEDMDLLFERMPRLARFMMLGIMCMFIAPFGMLIAKWATLVSFVDTHQVALIILLAFGSAATFMFWAKWLGKLAGVAGLPPNQEEGTHRSEWVSIGLMAMLALGCCVTLPLISSYVVEPYLHYLFGGIALRGEAFTAGISSSNLWIASLAAAIIFIVLFAGLGTTKARKVDVYLAGVSVDNSGRTFRDSLSAERTATARNWYMEGVFGEEMIAPIGTICSALVIIIAFAVSAISLPGLI
ncbi:MAG: hypothetical protein LBG81_01475 [Coriobacteriaceae bacterium]|nr:hypothetical protein [Coriobacteriaceae bacterium]